MVFRKAILIIHGFAGGTFDLEYLANSLEFQRNFDVFSFTLPGHDYGLGSVKKGEWVNSAEEHILNLINNGYKSIYVVGHSMGGVIGTYLASKYKEVKKLVLVAPAFHSFMYKDTKFNIFDSLKTGLKNIRDYKVSAVFARLRKLPRHSFVEFRSLVKTCYNSPSFVYVPTLIIQGNKDNIVPISSVNYVFSTLKSKYKEMIFVRDTGHDIFRGKRNDDVTKEIIKFLKHKNRRIEKEEKREI